MHEKQTNKIDRKQQRTRERKRVNERERVGVRATEFVCVVMLDWLTLMYIAIFSPAFRANVLTPIVKMFTSSAMLGKSALESWWRSVRLDVNESSKENGS